MNPKIKSLTLDRARAVLAYDPQSGSLNWRVNRGRGVRAGDAAGVLNKSNKCRYVTIDEERYLAHRLVWFMHYGEWPSENVSAKNGNFDDLRIDNLTLKTAAETARRTTARGVSLHKSGKWRVEITRNYKKHYLGQFDTEEEARSVYLKVMALDDPSVLQKRPTSSYPVKGSKDYYVLRNLWRRTMRDNGDVTGWASADEFFADLDGKAFPYCRVVPQNEDEVIGPGNFKVERMALYDRNTPEGRVAYYKHKNRVRKAEIKSHSLTKSFGITIADYQQMLHAQNGCCAICGGKEVQRFRGEVRALSVDHCHKTGDVRALLCHACNHGLGCFRDRPEFLRAAAQYIEHHATKSNRVPASDNPPEPRGARSAP